MFVVLLKYRLAFLHLPQLLAEKKAREKVRSCFFPNQLKLHTETYSFISFHYVSFFLHSCGVSMRHTFKLKYAAHM